MYCPECKAEYREGFDTCADCQIALVDGVPPELDEEEKDESGIRILLETTHPTSLDPIIIRLEQRGVPYIVQSGTALSLLEGLMVETLPEDWKAVVLVPSEHLETARAIAAEPPQQQSDAPEEEE